MATNKNLASRPHQVNVFIRMCQIVLLELRLKSTNTRLET
jgi:hypothetical protein